MWYVFSHAQPVVTSFRYQSRGISASVNQPINHTVLYSIEPVSRCNTEVNRLRWKKPKQTGTKKECKTSIEESVRKSPHSQSFLGNLAENWHQHTVMFHIDTSCDNLIKAASERSHSISPHSENSYFTWCDISTRSSTSVCRSSIFAPVWKLSINLSLILPCRSSGNSICGEEYGVTIQFPVSSAHFPLSPVAVLGFTFGGAVGWP